MREVCRRSSRQAGLSTKYTKKRAERGEEVKVRRVGCKRDKIRNDVGVWGCVYVCKVEEKLDIIKSEVHQGGVGKRRGGTGKEIWVQERYKIMYEAWE